MNERFPRQKFMETLIKCLSDERTLVRKRALEELLTYQDVPQDLMEKVNSMITEDEDASVRVAAINCMSLWSKSIYIEPTKPDEKKQLLG